MPAPSSTLLPTTPAARDVARRLLSRATEGADSSALVEAVERMWASIGGGLGRWFGPYGALALVSRALARAREDDPSLADVTATIVPSLQVSGLAEITRAHGAEATIQGAVAMLAALVELLGQLVGYDVATNILELSVAESPTSGSAVALGQSAVGAVGAINEQSEAQEP